MPHQENTRKKEQILLGSGLSSIISTLITNPVEVAKLNVQYFPLSCPQYPHQNYAEFSGCGCSKISWSGSLRSLKVAVPQVLFTNVVFMEAYEGLRGYLVNSHNFNSTTSTLLAALISRFLVTSANLPFESFRIKLSNDVVGKKLFKDFHGYKITLARDMINSTLFWSMLEGYRNSVVGGEYRGALGKKEGFSWKNFSINLMPGFMIGAFASAITTPFDTVKTRVQSQGIKNYQIISSIIKIYQTQGLMGLFSGVQLRVLKNSLHISIYLFIYEWYMSRIRTPLVEIAQC